MRQAPSFVDPNHPDYVYRLIKSIYGLKQAPRAWYQRLSSYLQVLGFKISQLDNSLFIFHGPTYVIFVLVYVDDIVITGSTSTAVSQLISSLQKEFAIKDLGPLHYSLALKATRDKSGLFLTQTKYALDLLKRFNMDGAKPVRTPMAAGLQLSQYQGDLLTDPSSYRSMVGALQ